MKKTHFLSYPKDGGLETLYLEDIGNSIGVKGVIMGNADKDYFFYLPDVAEAAEPAAGDKRAMPSSRLRDGPSPAPSGEHVPRPP